MKKIINRDHELLWKEAFEEFKRVLELLSSQKESIVLWLAGGNSLVGFYKYIKEHAAEIPLKVWQKLLITLVDERVVAIDHPDSNFGQLKVLFLDHLLTNNIIQESQLIPIDITVPNYLEKINNRIVSIDVALFWVWPDAHIWALFPHHHSISYSPKEYFYMDDSPKLPPQRITISPSFVKTIEYPFITFISEAKRWAFENFLDDSKTIVDAPVKLTQPATGLVIVSDQELVDS